MRRDAAPAATPKAFPGFNSWGGFFRSEAPVSNNVTRFVERMTIAIRDRKLSPSDVMLELLNTSSDVRQIFPPYVAAQWGGLNTFRDWGVALTCNSALETIKRQGKGRSPWADDNAWEIACADADGRKGVNRRTNETV